jgi:hypothetical protein
MASVGSGQSSTHPIESDPVVVTTGSGSGGFLHDDLDVHAAHLNVKQSLAAKETSRFCDSYHLSSSIVWVSIFPSKYNPPPLQETHELVAPLVPLPAPISDLGRRCTILSTIPNVLASSAVMK